jgi:tRNA (guanine-N7-)-methyltransferase
MRYNQVKGADKIMDRSSYLVSNPTNYKNKWKDLFHNNNPIHLELGMGRGEFIITMAQNNPRINFIGLEIDDGQMATAIKKLGNKNLPNLLLIKTDAKNIDQIFGREINTIYLTFSEPWPKRIDENKRFTHPNFLKLYDRIFRKDKHIILKTDNKVLFQYSLESLSQYWYVFEKVSLDLHNDERKISNVMTDWEIKCKQDGKQIYYIDAKFNE